MRKFLLAAVAAIALATALAVSGGVPTASASGSCTNSWGSDGHAGPWYVGSDQSLHGNTLVISCPSGSTPWSIDYQVCKSSGTTCDFTPIDQSRSGNGSISFSFGKSAVGCNQGWNYWTHVHNVVTGGDISKPSDHTFVIC